MTDLVYLSTNGVKSHIKSVEDFDKVGFDWDKIQAVYHTIISTCKMQGVSVLDYFKRFFSEIVKGRRDYEHLLPLTIGLNQ